MPERPAATRPPTLHRPGCTGKATGRAGGTAASCAELRPARHRIGRRSPPRLAPSGPPAAPAPRLRGPGPPPLPLGVVRLSGPLYVSRETYTEFPGKIGLYPCPPSADKGLGVATGRHRARPNPFNVAHFDTPSGNAAAVRLGPLSVVTAGNVSIELGAVERPHLANRSLWVSADARRPNLNRGISRVGDGLPSCSVSAGRDQPRSRCQSGAAVLHRRDGRVEP